MLQRTSGPEFLSAHLQWVSPWSSVFCFPYAAALRMYRAPGHAMQADFDRLAAHASPDLPRRACFYAGYYGASESQTFSEASSSGRDYLAEVCRDWEAEAQRSTAKRNVVLRTGAISMLRSYFFELTLCCRTAEKVNLALTRTQMQRPGKTTSDSRSLQ